MDKALQGTTPPSEALLPVEPQRPFPLEALEGAASRRTAGVTPYQLSSSDFEIAFITPVVAYAAELRSDRTGGDGRNRSADSVEAAEERRRLLTDFGRWSEYLADHPPVLLVRVTPKIEEGFWTTLARGAARTQGMALPPIKRIQSAFARMRVFCGATEVPPIQPFVLEARLSQRDVLREGLYVFDPEALAPQCGSIKLVLYSEKEPEKGETRTVDPRVIQEIWQDFAPYRESGA
jgi:hypothetical protein